MNTPMQTVARTAEKREKLHPPPFRRRIFRRKARLRNHTRVDARLKMMKTINRTPGKPPNSPTEEEIAERAYWIWESEGHPIGREEEHRRQAQMELYMSRALNDALESDSDTC